MSNYRLVVYEPDGEKRGALTHTTSWDASFPFNDVPALSLSLPKAYANLVGVPCEIAVEAWDNGTWKECRQGRYCVIQAEQDRSNGDTDIVKYKGQGYASLLDTTVVIPKNYGSFSNYDDDGRRFFDGRTPGFILTALLSEAKLTIDGLHPKLEFAFDSMRDSKGELWDRVTTIAYEHGTSLLTILQALADQNLVDWHMEGRTLYVYNASSGCVDTGKLIDINLNEAPVRSSAADLVHSALLVGDEYTWLTENNEGTPKPWGKSLKVINQGGVKHEFVAKELARAEMDKGARIRDEYTCQYQVDSDVPLPCIDFEVGDYIVARSSTRTRQEMRVFSAAISDDNGAQKITLTLNDLFIDREIRRSRMLKGITNGAVGSAGNGSAPKGSSDGKPKTPVGLVGESWGYWADESGIETNTPRAAVQLAWAPVVQDINNNPVALGGYEVNVAGKSISVGENETLATLEDFACGYNVTASVRAFTKAGIKSDWASIRVATDYPGKTLDPPTPPILHQSNGIVSIEWDGKLRPVDPGKEEYAPPSRFNHVRARYSTFTNGHTTDMVDAGTLSGPGFLTLDLTGLEQDSVATVDLIAIDHIGGESEPSQKTSVTLDFPIRREIQEAHDYANNIAAELAEEREAVHNRLAGVTEALENLEESQEKLEEVLASAEEELARSKKQINNLFAIANASNNYLRNTYSLDGWSKSSAVTFSDEISGCRKFAFPASSSSALSVFALPNMPFAELASETLTFSVMVKSPSNSTGKFSVYFELVNGETNTTSRLGYHSAPITIKQRDNEWTLHSYTFTADKAAFTMENSNTFTKDCYLRLRFYQSAGQSGELHFKLAKLEKGSAVTSWSPHPADDVDLFAALKNQVTETAARLESTRRSMQAQLNTMSTDVQAALTGGVSVDRLFVSEGAHMKAAVINDLVADNTFTTALMASQILVEPTDIAPEPGKRPGFWIPYVQGTTSAGLDAVREQNGTAATCHYGKYWRIHAVSDSKQRGVIAANLQAITPGAEYAWQIQVSNNNDGCTRNLIFGFTEYDKTKTSLRTTTVLTVKPSEAGGIKTGTYTPQSDVSYVRAWVQLRGGTDDVGNRYWYNTYCKPKAGSVLIQDGAVTADKVDAQSVAGAVGSFIKINANQIAAGKLTAGQIDVPGVINAADISAKKISTSQLVADAAGFNDAVINKLVSDTAFIDRILSSQIVVEPNEYAPDPARKPQWWRYSGAASQLAITASSTGQGFRLANNTAANYVIGKTLPVKPRQKIAWAINIKRSNTAVAGRIRCYVNWLDSSGTSTNAFLLSKTDADISTSYKSFSGVWTVPDGAVSMNMRIVADQASTNSGHYWYAYGYSARAQANSVLIENGAITGEKITMDSALIKKITAEDVWAGKVSTNMLMSTVDQKAGGVGTTISSGGVLVRGSAGRIQLSNTGLEAWNAKTGGTRTFFLNAASGTVSMKGSLTSGSTITGSTITASSFTSGNTGHRIQISTNGEFKAIRDDNSVAGIIDANCDIAEKIDGKLTGAVFHGINIASPRTDGIINLVAPRLGTLAGSDITGTSTLAATGVYQYVQYIKSTSGGGLEWQPRTFTFINGILVSY